MPNQARAATSEWWMDQFGVLFIPEPNTGCWLWARSCQSFGYGQIMVARKMKAMVGRQFARLKDEHGNRSS